MIIRIATKLSDWDPFWVFRCQLALTRDPPTNDKHDCVVIASNNNPPNVISKIIFQANCRITSAQLLVLLVVDENLLIIVKDGLAVWSEPLELGWGLSLANLITSEEVIQAMFYPICILFITFIIS